ncbi:hypothetical protein TrCOL_g11122 [Triparma columacea]|uniref:ABC1 atypical kinase-like domain-containing protein n=1 Tax=Triparma columacea TaxID=722753 RepID=A0A9W7LEF8_9STRA|nr:hypothetical protein TrCOL_g11122 [Triparma columacea]
MQRAIFRSFAAVSAASLGGVAAQCDDEQRLTVGDYSRFVSRTTSTIWTVGKIVTHYKFSKSSSIEDKIKNAEKNLSLCQEVYTGDGSGGKQNQDEKERKNAVRIKEIQRNKVLEAADALAVLEDRHRSAPASLNKHRWAAEEILRLCRRNKGCYIKIGQHLANLDYLLPAEYTQTLQELYNDSPVSSYPEVRELVLEELGAYPEEIFDAFDPKPLASASLAQVHTAVDKKTKKRVAVKIQHPSVGLTAKGDIFVLTKVVRFLESYFEEFTFGWLVDEIAPQIFLELDFANEANNTRRAKKELEAEFPGKVCVPEILAEYSTSRLMAMTFEEGFLATDVEKIERAGLKREDVSSLISSIFGFQVFTSGFVHCDPHPANLLVRPNPNTGAVQVVLLDHGLYKTLGGEFMRDYANLWTSIVMADIDMMKSTCEKFGVTEMYPLLAAIITSRPFDEILDRRGGRRVKRTKKGKGDKAMIRMYAERYMTSILHLLETVPRDLLLLLKMNDCLRHINSTLGADNNITMEIQANWALWGSAWQGEKRRWRIDARRWAEGWLKYLWGRARVYVLFASLRWNGQ